MLREWRRCTWTILTLLSLGQPQAVAQVATAAHAGPSLESTSPVLTASAQGSQPGAPTHAILPPEAFVPPGYVQLIERASRAFEGGHYAEARDGFSEALRLMPSAHVLHALGTIELAVRDYPAAQSYLRRALASHDRPLNPEQRRATEALLSQARAQLARVFLVVRPAEAGLQVTVDGKAVTVEPDGSLLLSEGLHLLDVHAAGYHAAHRNLRITGGAAQRLELQLVPLALPPPVILEAPPPIARPSHKRRRPWLWTTLGGAVLAGAATGLALGLSRSKPNEPEGGTTRTVLVVPAKP